uniref:Uncharacterized protein n=1 Tax=Romanomermis culicivorax TaxID=13658 RepID=A0A915IQ18_ROMCU
MVNANFLLIISFFVLCFLDCTSEQLNNINPAVFGVNGFNDPDRRPIYTVGREPGYYSLYSPYLLSSGQYQANTGYRLNPDAKWPAYGMDAPANFQTLGRYSHTDQFIQPANVPRWYNQPLGGQFFKQWPMLQWDPQIVGNAYVGR